MARITINGIAVDPLKYAPALAAARLTSADASASNFILIQASGPLDAGQRDQLAKLGVAILEYVPDDTYLCRYTPADLAKIRALPFVTWANVYMSDFKVAAALRAAPATPVAPGTANLLSLPALDTLSRDRVTVDVVLHKAVDATAVRDRIAAAAGLDPKALEVGSSKVRMTVERRQLKDLAAIDEVQHIEPYVPPHLCNNIARGILTTDSVQAGGDLQGENQIVAVADTGFDTGDTADVHLAFTARVHKLYPLGRATASDPDGHGTHVCGSVLGDGVMQDGTAVRGTAPKAQLVMQSLLDGNGGLGGLPTDLHDLFIVPYRDDGARVHSNSWGAPTRGRYDSSASEVDDFIFNHRDCVVCFAAGNDGVDSQGIGVIDPGSIGSPGVAKNCIAVGASENNRPTFMFPGAQHPSTYGDGWPANYRAAPIHDDPVADNSEGMAAFSSRGPAATGRVRPDVVAPGTAILSARGRVATGNVWQASADPLYSYEGGTSMATPLVAGCAAVVRQYLQSKGVAQPTAALVKAMLINGARSMMGQYQPPEVGLPPDNSQGFGRIDLAATVGPFPAGTSLTWQDELTALDTGQQADLVQPIAANQTLKVTLAWTDPAGDALQNDLDLIVTMPNGQESHGNMQVGAPGFDRSNNVEQVILSSDVDGSATISVRTFRATVPQAYALVIRVS